MENKTAFKGITEEQAYDLSLLFEKHHHSFEKAYADPIVDNIRQDVLSRFDVEIDGILMGFVNPLTYEVMAEFYMVRSPRYLFVYKTLNDKNQGLFLALQSGVIMLTPAETNEITPADTVNMDTAFTVAEIGRAGYNVDNYNKVRIYATDNASNDAKEDTDDQDENVLAGSDDDVSASDSSESVQVEEKVVQGYKPTKPSL